MENEVTWNLWHGCRKYSEGCANCYVYRQDAKYDRDASEVFKTASFDMPIKRNRKGEYKYPSGTIFYTCFSSDFLLEEADEWRKEAWDMVRERSDCRFMFITKRILRFSECVPPDWGEGWDNVTVCITAENQRRADERYPYFLSLPIKHKIFINEPLLSEIDLSPYLRSDVEQVVCGGESGSEARVCDYAWILKLRRACVEKNVTFIFKQTGAKFLKDGRLYRVPRAQQHRQAARAGIDFEGDFPFVLSGRRKEKV